ncbi:MAG: FecR domain-containing protein [Rhodothermales bacterium]|nr:FecR domain-containing protein [Rhodothermales bacterium]
MHDDSSLPDSDRELIAARLLGKRLEEGTTAGSSDPLVVLLDRFRTATETHRAAHLPSPDQSARLWQAIVQQVTTPAEAGARPPVRRQRTRSRFIRLSIAASLVGVLALVWLITQRAEAPELLAEAAEAAVIYTTEEGSIITMRPHSRLYRFGSVESTRQFRLDGEAYFDVVHDQSRLFTVHSADAVVAVLGTQFVVRTWGESVEVFLKSGSVSLQHAPSGSAVVLKPGDLGRVNSLGAEVAGTGGSEEDALDWIDDELRFAQQPIARVVDELAFHFGVVIEFPSERLAETISGTIILDSPRSALDQLGAATNSVGIQAGAQVYRFETRP